MYLTYIQPLYERRGHTAAARSTRALSRGWPGNGPFPDGAAVNRCVGGGRARSGTVRQADRQAQESRQVRSYPDCVGGRVPAGSLKDMYTDILPFAHII